MQHLLHLSEVAHNGTIDLRKLYPISHFWPIMRSSYWLGAFILSLVSIGVVDYYWTSNMENETGQNIIQFAMAIILISNLFGWLIRFLIYELEMWHIDYRVDNGHLHINKGIFLKQKGSFPLSRITDIYLDRSFFDLVFGLWNVHVSTPTESSGAFARIHGLSEKNAVGLQRALSELVQGTSIDLNNLSHNITHHNLLHQNHKMDKKQEVPNEDEQLPSSSQHDLSKLRNKGS